MISECDGETLDVCVLKLNPAVFSTLMVLNRIHSLYKSSAVKRFHLQEQCAIFFIIWSILLYSNDTPWKKLKIKNVFNEFQHDFSAWFVYHWSVIPQHWSNHVFDSCQHLENVLLHIYYIIFQYFCSEGFLFLKYFVFAALCFAYHTFDLSILCWYCMERCERRRDSESGFKVISSPL